MTVASLFLLPTETTQFGSDAAMAASLPAQS